MKLYKFAILSVGAFLVLASCRTQQKSGWEWSPKKSPTFSVYSENIGPAACKLRGHIADCHVIWTVKRGILTHRKKCKKEGQFISLRPLLLSMARSLKESCPLKIRYARLTAKDDEYEELRLARMMSQSKLWAQFSKKGPEKSQKFPSEFLKKVFKVKGLFGELSEALNTQGYSFEIEEVDIKKFSDLTQSRHFKSLKVLKRKTPFLIPENIRVVWENKNFRALEGEKSIFSKDLKDPDPKKKEQEESISSRKKRLLLPSQLPDKTL